MMYKLISVGLLMCLFFLPQTIFMVYGQGNRTGLRESSISYHLSFDDDAFFKEDFIEESGKKSLEERNIDFPAGRFGKGIRMSEIPQIPDDNNMTGIDLDLVTAVIFNTRPGNEMGFNQPFIWGSGRINPRLGALSFWAKGTLAFAGPLFEQTSVGFGRKERDLLGVVVDEDDIISAYIRDARYVRHTLQSEKKWDPEVWNHVVLNWDWANGMELWINGEKIASNWGEDGWFETTLPGLFHLPAAGITYDEFYLFDRPVTREEINELVTKNTFTETESLKYERTIERPERIAEVSGANLLEKMPAILGNEAFKMEEVWPQEVADEHVPGWFVVDGRNEIAWPHTYSMFTIIPGDADFHAEKVDIKTSASSKVNYVTLTGNLTNVRVLSSTARRLEMEEVLQVPLGDQFSYSAKIDLQEGAEFRIPFTERYGTPEEFSGDIHVPLSGEKRLQNVGLYYYGKLGSSAVESTERKLQFGPLEQGSLDDRTKFAIHALTSRDERNFVVASEKSGDVGVEKIDIGRFARLNILSDVYETDKGIKSVTLSLPLKTKESEEALFIRVRDPAVPSRLWNQFTLKLVGFDQEVKTLNLKIDFQDIVVAKGDRLWLDIGAARSVEVVMDKVDSPPEILVEEVATFICVDDYAKKEIVSAQAQYAKMYEFMPWQFTGKTVTLSDPYCYGGPFDMILPALAIVRTKPDHFISNYLIEACGKDFKDGKPIHPEETPLMTVENPMKAPEWALYMHDFNIKREAIVDWWAERQNENGELGGGWNDDVLFLSFHQPDLPLDGNDKARALIDAAHDGLERTRYFKDGFCNIFPMDRMHIGDFISERYNTVLNNLGKPYPFERELESAWRLDKTAETPINYYADAFKSSVNIFNWFWGTDIPQKPYISKSIEELTKEFQLYTSVLNEHAMFRFTESNVHRDDFSPYGANTIYTYLLGGQRGTRLDAHMELAVTWPAGGGVDMPRLVRYADDKRLDFIAFSFDDELRDLTLRPCRLADGRYRIQILKDMDEEGKTGDLIWEEEMDVHRFDLVSIPIPPRTAVGVKIEQIESMERPEELPDLAIESRDVTWGDMQVSCSVHNLGNGSVKNVRVDLYDGEVLLGTKVIDQMEAPIDFLAKNVQVTFEQVKFSANLSVVLDPLNQIQEILEDNNKAFVFKASTMGLGTTN